MSIEEKNEILKKSLSEQRFATYLKEAKNNEILAFELYLYNLRLAESFLLPLNITEIKLRNTVDGVLISKYGHDWHLSYYFRHRVLNNKSRESLDEAIERIRKKEAIKRKTQQKMIKRAKQKNIKYIAHKNYEKIIIETAFKFWVNLLLRKKTKNNEILDEEKVRTKQDNRGKIIAETTFGFWSNLLTQKGYTKKIWRSDIYTPFPHLKEGEGLVEVRKLVRDIGHLRNRIAHHEPIFNMKIQNLHENMIQLTRSQCQITAEWMQLHSRVIDILETDPRKGKVHHSEEKSKT